MSNNVFADIKNMHEKFKVHETVKNMSPEVLKQFLKFRISCIEEELNETKSAFEVKDWDGLVDGLIDGIVFSVGTLNIFQVDGERAWTEVLNANLQKSVGEKPSRKNDFGFPDLIKPEGWQSPCHEHNIGILPNTVA